MFYKWNGFLRQRMNQRELNLWWEMNQCDVILVGVIEGVTKPKSPPSNYQIYAPILIHI